MPARAASAQCAELRRDAASLTFSTRGVGDPGSRSRWTSRLKGLHYKRYARLCSSNFPPDLVRRALRLAVDVIANDCSHKSRAGKRLGLHYSHFGRPVPLFKRLGGRLIAENSAFWRRVEKVGLMQNILPAPAAIWTRHRGGSTHKFRMQRVRSPRGCTVFPSGERFLQCPLSSGN